MRNKKLINRRNDGSSVALNIALEKGGKKKKKKKAIATFVFEFGHPPKY